MMKLISHQFQITEAMQEAVEQQFNFLSEEELTPLRLTIEPVNPHRLRIKVVYQKTKQKPLVMEVLVQDFYQGVEQLSKKMRQALRRQENKLRRRQDKVALGLALSEMEALEQEELRHQLTEVEVPIYRLTQDEAMKQLELFEYRVLMYYDLDQAFICTLVKQSDGSIKRYIGME